MSANFQISKKYRETSGYQEMPLDLFTDVKKALHSWLITNDPEFRRNSDLSKARNKKTRETAHS